MSIQWYPGHIAKARREIREHLKEVDIVIEVVDARCPYSSINFLYDELKNKKRLIVVNKYDLADKEVLKDFNKAGIEKYSNTKFDGDILFLDSRNNSIKKVVDKKIDSLLNSINVKNANKGIVNTVYKAMVVGMPNVGKSTFINSYVKKKVNKVENTPGVTKALKWTKISDKLLLLDTPGVTTKKFENDNIGINLALVGSINDDIIEKQDLAFEFISKIKSRYFELLKKRYKLIETNKDSDSLDILNEIASKTNSLKKGGEYNYDKVSNLIINDFRKGTLGNISLEEWYG